MAAYSSLSRVALMSLLCTILLLIEPYNVLAQTKDLYEISDKALITPPGGMCALAVTIHGYKCHEFQVRTDDGYILSVQRIPQGRSGIGSANKNKPPVLLQHGLLVDGMTWLFNSPDQSLPLILADKGFDVWINNIRGTRFSRHHVTLHPSNPEYWDWTWDELATHDLPAVIDFIFKQTGQTIHYVGHSMGTLIALASFSEVKQIDKVKSAAFLCPVAYLSHMTTALGVLAARYFVGEFTAVFGIAEFNPKGVPVANFVKALCAQPGVNCYDLLTAITGENCCLNTSNVKLLLENEPQSTSTKNLVHMAQTVRNGILAKYDYGNDNYNLLHYGKYKPPRYNLSNIPRDFPLFLTYGGRDSLSDSKDVETLLDNLKLHDPDKLSVQYIKNYAHVDFIMGVNANMLVYDQVIMFFRRHG